MVSVKLICEFSVGLQSLYLDWQWNHDNRISNRRVPSIIENQGKSGNFKVDLEIPGNFKVHIQKNSENLQIFSQKLSKSLGEKWKMTQNTSNSSGKYSKIDQTIAEKKSMIAGKNC